MSVKMETVPRSHKTALITNRLADSITTIGENKRDSCKLKNDEEKLKTNIIDMNTLHTMKNNNYVLFNSNELLRRNNKRESNCYSYCLFSVLVSFILGLSLGVIVTSSSPELRNVVKENIIGNNSSVKVLSRTLNSVRENKIDVEYSNEKDTDGYRTVSFIGDNHKYKKDVIYPKGLSEDMKEILKDNKDTVHKLKINIIRNTTLVPNSQSVLYNNVYWGPKVEDYMPQGYGKNSAEIWESYVNQSEVVKMEAGCGRMQNRLVTFRDGIQACVRYRQNTDQIQGEIFSFYVARLLNLTNLAPSVVRVVDLKDKLWRNVRNDIANAKWSVNRAVVLTQYIPSLDPATIPEVFKPTNRHLNKYDIIKLLLKENYTESKHILTDKLKVTKMTKSVELKNNFDHIDMNISRSVAKLFVELAQWSDLIIFDYLTANLDRIVNNLFNYQWNVNIMDGPAHNLAKKMDSGLLLFLDNESGLLHGYRLLKKYNVYHSSMLDNLCMFRKTTVDALKSLYESHVVGRKLSDMFHEKNNAIVRDILPSLPEKNGKILHDRIGKVLNQIEKCEQNFSS